MSPLCFCLFFVFLGGLFSLIVVVVGGGGGSFYLSYFSTTVPNEGSHGVVLLFQQ